MLIKFKNLPELEEKNFRGGEGSFFYRTRDDGHNKIILGKLEPMSSIGMHTHYKDSEIIYVTKGEATLIFDGEKLPLVQGDCHYCPKGHDHSIINTSNADFEFFAVIARQ